MGKETPFNEGLELSTSGPAASEKPELSETLGKKPDWWDRGWKRYLEAVDILGLEDPRRQPSPEAMRKRYGSV